MNFSDTLDAITSRWKAEIEDAYPIASIYDNDPTQPPNNTDYVEVNVLFGESRQITLGADRRWRTVGVLTAVIKVQANKGMKAAVLVADAITAAFRGTTEAEVHYKTPSITNAGRNGRFWQVISTCDFYVDDLE